MKYKEFELDQFQIDSIESIEKNHSVVVSAATGTGKTLIADYIIDKALKENKRVIYTAPIKALSNQKFRDFKKAYGSRVGIMTGDVVINERAEILIMTTEIYRNMLLTKDYVVNEVSYVVFDEIHYINDIERGTVWEESVIFSPEHIRFLCLSATIPNAKQFAAWIQEIKKHNVDVVTYAKRAVPLEHLCYEFETGLTTAKEVRESIDLDRSTPQYERVVIGGKKKRKRIKAKVASHIDLVKELNGRGFLPAIYFAFSRKACQEKALKLPLDFTTPEEKKYIIQFFNKMITEQVKHMESVRVVKSVLVRGIGIHHAGLLPILKEIVEKLFNEGIIKVLYTTETFAVGINMPAKAVCFDSLEKYDGITFRYLHTKEYFQLAGRAGRRGIDKKGESIVMIDRNHEDMEKVIKVTSKDVEPIVSQFDTSYNTVLNLKKYHEEDQIVKILKSNFGYFVKRLSSKQSRIMTSYSHKVRILKKLGMLKSDGKLTEKGEFACFIYSHEIELTELAFSGALHNLNEAEINILIASLEYEPRMSDKFSFKNIDKEFHKLIRIVEKNKYVARKIKPLKLKRMINTVKMWSSGCEFEELLNHSNLLEGDIIRMFRRIIDVLKQMEKATTDQDLREKFVRCIHCIDRDVVRVEF